MRPRVRVGDLYVSTEATRTLSDEFPAGSKFAVVKIHPGRPKTYYLRLWPFDGCRGFNTAQRLPVSGTAFEVPTHMDEWIGRTVTVMHDMTTNGGVVFKAGEKMLVDGHYRGKLCLHIPGNKHVCIRGVGRTIYSVCLEPK